MTKLLYLEPTLKIPNHIELEGHRTLYWAITDCINHEKYTIMTNYSSFITK